MSEQPGPSIEQPGQYIYQLKLLRPALLTAGPTPDEAEVLSAHVDYLQQLAQRATVLLAGRTQNTDASCFGIVILQADTESQALQIMQQDPAVKGGVMQASLFPYQIAVLSDAIRC